MYESCLFFFNVLFFTPKILIIELIACSVASGCSVGFVFIRLITLLFLSSCGRGISAVSLANPGIAVLCLGHNWRCI